MTEVTTARRQHLIVITDSFLEIICNLIWLTLNSLFVTELSE